MVSSAVITVEEDELIKFLLQQKVKLPTLYFPILKHIEIKKKK